MNKQILFLLFSLSLISYTAQGQIYNMTDSASNITCSGTFFDPGGATQNYPDNIHYTETFCTSNGGQQVNVLFNSFSTEANYDILYVYDGPNATSPLIGSYSGNVSPGTIQSNNIYGCLTFVFVSDSSVNFPGWDATISCVSVPPPSPSDTICPFALPFCTGTTVTFTAHHDSTGNPTHAFPGQYNCLFSSPNPTWFFFQIQTGGNMNIAISGWDSSTVPPTPRDVDFICWGPFSSIDSMCGNINSTRGNNVVSCSYSGSNIENDTIPNALPGQFYLMLVTNFSNQRSTISFNQTSGNASTNCNVICDLDSITAIASACDSTTNTYSVSGNVYLHGAPVAGDLVIKYKCGTVTIFDTVFRPFTSDTVPFSFQNLVPNGGSCTVSAIFTSNRVCQVSTAFQAPNPCNCSTIASNNGPICAGDTLILKTTPVVGATYTWSGPNGFTGSGQTIHVPNASVGMSGVYSVTVSKSGGGCHIISTTTVVVANAITLSYTPIPDTICLYGSTTLNVTASPATEGPFTYAWLPTASLNLSNTASVIASPAVTTTYNVTVRSNAGCTKQINPLVVVRGVGPRVTVIASSNTAICPGDSIQLTGYASQLTCELNPNPATACTAPNAIPFIAQVPPTAGISSTGPFTNSFSPFYQDEPNARVQYLFRASELQPLLGGASTVTGIEFNVSSIGANVIDFSNYTIKMGCTNLSQLPAASFIPNLSTVLNPNTLSAAGISTGWYPFTFDNPYDWDGISNVVIEICFSNTGFSFDDDEVTYSSAFQGATNQENNFGTPGCNLNNTGGFGFTQYALRPDVKFLGCTAPSPNYTFNWSPPTGLACDTCIATKAKVNTNTTYLLNVSDGTCLGSGSVVLTVDSATLLATHDTVKCGTDTVTIGVRQQFPVVPVCVADYDLSSITAYNEPLTGTQPTLIVGSWDDGYTGALPIGFPFTFYCNSYTNFYLCSNGWITFSPATTTNLGAALLPSATQPENIVAGVWTDLVYTNPLGPVTYYTSGTAPNRKAVINYSHGIIYGGSDSVTFQIVLHETTNQIDINYIQVDPNGGNFHLMTAGVENSTGTVATALPGRNQSTWLVSTPESWRFTPRVSTNSIASVAWTPTTGLDSPTVAITKAYPSATTQYVAHVTFANGCQATDTVNVNVQAFPHSLTFRDSICPGDTTMIHFSANHIRDYAWSPNLNISDTSIANPIVTATQTMNYRLIAHDSLGCGFDTTIIVHMRHLPNFSLGRDTAICAYDSLILSPTGGPFVSYTWSPIASTPTITVKNTGTYALTVSDGHCTDADTINIVSFQNPHLKADSSQSLCSGSCTNIYAHDTIHFHGYHWNTGFLTNNIQVCFPGTYFYSALDSIGCTWHSDTARINVTTPPVITFTKTKGDTICPLDSNVVNAGSLAGIVYTWNPGGVRNTLTITAAGTYIVTASDHGCTSTDSVVQYVRTHAPISIAYLGKLKDTVCTNSCVPLTPSGGPYNTYTWQPGGASTPTLSACTAGAYSVIVSDNLCSYPSDTFHLYNYSNTPFTITPATDTICPNTVVTLLAQAGFTNYQWANGGPASPANIVSAGGIYTCTALDGGGCTVTASATVTVDIPPVITFTFFPNDTFCTGGIDTIDAGSLRNVTYTWNGTSVGNTYQTNISGAIHVDAVDAKNCHTTADTVVTAIAPPTFSLGPNISTCNCDTQIVLNPGIAGRYSWTPITAGSNSPTYTVTKTTSDTIITATIVNPYGCISSSSTVIKILCLQLTYGTSVPITNTLANGAPITLTANTVYSNRTNYIGGPFSYVWTPNQYLDSSTTRTVISTPQASITYHIQVTDNSTGCTDTVSIPLNVDVPGFAIPTGFVPFGTNPNNRYFYPVIPHNSGVLVINLKIYDRWGQLVYNNPVSPGWDGTLDGVLQPMDTYIYYMTITYPDLAHPGQTKTDLRSGSISLIR